MAEAFESFGDNGGAITDTASSASVIAGALSGKVQAYRIVTDAYVRIKFGTSSVSAGATSQEFAPGETYINRQNGTADYWSAVTPTGTANISINPGQFVNVSPQMS